VSVAIGMILREWVEMTFMHTSRQNVSRDNDL